MRVKKESKKTGLKLNVQKTKIMASSPITSWHIDGETIETVTDFLFLGSKITADGDCSHEIKMLAPWKKSYDQPRQHIKEQKHLFANKGPSSQSYGFFSSHVLMWKLDHKENWVPKNRCFPSVMLEKTLESPLDSKEIKPVNPKGSQPWIFIGRTHAEAETPILRLPDAKNGLIGKDPDAGKDWRQEEKGMTKDEMVGWHHWLNGQVWASSRNWWWTGKPGLEMLQSMGSQRVGHDWATELNWIELTCILRNLYNIKKQQLEQDMEQWTSSKLGKVRQGCILSPCLLNSYAEYLIQNTRWITSWNHDCWEKYQ